MFNAGEVFVDLGGKFNPAAFAQFGAATAKAGGDMRKAESAIVASQSRMGKASAALGTVAKTGAAAGILGIGVAAYKAVNLAADFEEQLSSLGSVSGASAKQLGVLRAEAISAGKATKFSALDAAVAQTELAKGGVKLRDMGGALKGALALAAAGELDLGTAAATTANALNLFGLQGSQATSVADALAAAANATTADVGDFAMALSQGGGAAKAAGLSFNETVTALEALALAGVKGSDAGTSLKTTLAQLANPTDKAAGMAKKLGLNFFDAQGSLKPLPAIADDLRDAFGGLTDKQRLAAAQTIAGTDGFRTLLALYDAGAPKLRELAEGNAAAGTAAEVAAEKQDNLRGKLENLKGSVETLGIELGTKALPGLTNAAEAATEFVNALSGEKTSGKFQIVEDLIALGEVIGPVGKELADFTGFDFGGMDLGLGEMVAEAKQLVDDFLGVVTTFADAELALLNAFNSLPGPDIDTSKLEANIANINQMREELRGDPVQLEVDTGTAAQQLVTLASQLRALGKSKQVDLVLRGADSAEAAVGGLKALLSGVPRQKVTQILAKADSAEAQVLAFKAILAGVPASKVARIVGSTKGKAEIDALNSSIRAVPASKRPAVNANARGKPEVDALNASLFSVPLTKRPQVSASTTGIGGVQALGGAIASVNSKSVTLTMTTIARKITSIETRRGRAAGRGSGASEKAIVGEGSRWQGAREAIVSPADPGSLLVVEGAQAVDLAPGDYVIPYEDRYRGRAIGLIQALAADMGLTGYAAGKKGRAAAKKPPPKKSTANTRYQPKPLEPLSLPVEELDAKRNDALSVYTKRRDALQDLPGKLRDLRDRQKDVRGRAARTPATRAKKRRDLREIADDIAANRKRQDDEKKRVAELRADWKQRERELRTAQDYAKKIRTQEKIADGAATDMSNADKRDDQGAYDAAKRRRGGALGELKRLMAEARKKIESGSEYSVDVDNRLASIEGELIDNSAASSDAQQEDARAREDAARDAEQDAQEVARQAEEDRRDAAEKAGRIARGEDLSDPDQATSDRLEAALALTKVDTPDDFRDDASVAQMIVAFQEGVLNNLRSSPTAVPTAIKQAADAVASSRDLAKDLAAKAVAAGSTSGSDEIVRQRLDQLEAYGAQRQQALGAFGSNVASGGVIINQQYDAPPPDPHTWSQGVRFNLTAALGI